MAALKSETIRNVTAYADAVQAGFTGDYSAWCAVLGNIGGDMGAVAIQRAKYTLLAINWEGNEYNLEEDFPSNEYVFIFIDRDGDEMTNLQLQYWYAADMLGSVSNKIIAHDTVPDIDIPIVITLIKLISLGDSE